MECFKYAFNILTVSDGMCTINLGGLQADLKGGSGRTAAPPAKKKVIKYFRPKLRPRDCNKQNERTQHATRTKQHNNTQGSYKTQKLA